VFVVSPKHLFAKRKNISIDDLGSETFIAHNVVSPYRDVVLREFQRHKVPLNMEIAVGDNGIAVLKDYQLDPVRDRLIHIDLLEISMTEKIVSTVNVRLEGEAQGVKDGGVLEQASHELEVEALPADLPPEIVVDVSELVAGNAIRVADISLPAGVAFKSDPETVVAAVMQASTMDQIEAEQAAEAEALGLVPEEGEAGEAGEAEGEAAAADEDAAPASE